MLCSFRIPSNITFFLCLSGIRMKVFVSSITQNSYILVRVLRGEIVEFSHRLSTRGNGQIWVAQDHPLHPHLLMGSCCVALTFAFIGFKIGKANAGPLYPQKLVLASHRSATQKRDLNWDPQPSLIRSRESKWSPVFSFTISIALASMTATC